MEEVPLRLPAVTARGVAALRERGVQARLPPGAERGQARLFVTLTRSVAKANHWCREHMPADAPGLLAIATLPTLEELAWMELGDLEALLQEEERGLEDPLLQARRRERVPGRGVRSPCARGQCSWVRRRA